MLIFLFAESMFPFTKNDLNVTHLSSWFTLTEHWNRAYIAGALEPSIYCRSIGTEHILPEYWNRAYIVGALEQSIYCRNIGTERMCVIDSDVMSRLAIY